MCFNNFLCTEVWQGHMCVLGSTSDVLFLASQFFFIKIQAYIKYKGNT